MSEYIKKMAAVSVIRKYEFGKCPEYMQDWATKLKRAILQDIVDDVMEIPAADVVPVVHGRWDRVKNPHWHAYSHDKCSICGWWNTKNALCYDGNHEPGHSLNYCPNCGARMDGGTQ